MLVALIAIGGALYLKYWRSRHGTDTTTQTHTTATKQYAPTSGGTNPPNTSKESSASTSDTTSTSSSGLPAPAGQLLNKQAISLSSTAPQTDPNLESICQTVAQASCDINLSGPSGQVKTVGAQSTGSNGTVIFDWNAKTVGLTPGKWAVQAVATQNNATGKSHTEYLEVQP